MERLALAANRHKTGLAIVNWVPIGADQARIHSRKELCVSFGLNPYPCSNHGVSVPRSSVWGPPNSPLLPRLPSGVGPGAN